MPKENKSKQPDESKAKQPEQSAENAAPLPEEKLEQVSGGYCGEVIPTIFDGGGW